MTSDAGTVTWPEQTRVDRGHGLSKPCAGGGPGVPGWTLTAAAKPPKVRRGVDGTMALSSRCQGPDLCKKS
jgi:hypothetical protein